MKWKEKSLNCSRRTLMAPSSTYDALRRTESKCDKQRTKCSQQVLGRGNHGDMTLMTAETTPAIPADDRDLPET
jgi:hypothetical protein